MKLFGNPGKLMLALAFVFAVSLASQSRAADTGKITGKVLGKDGAASAGIKIRLVNPPEKKKDAPTAAPADKKERPKPVAEGTTESDGTFTLKDVKPGDYILNAMGKGKEGGRAREKVTVKAGEETKVELKLSDAKPGKEGGKKKPQ